jgi:hypothetical protein
MEDPSAPARSFCCVADVRETTAWLFSQTPCERRPAIASPDVGRREREASGHPPLIPPRPSRSGCSVDAGLHFAFHPLGDLEFVIGLKHDLLLLGKERAPVS